MHVTDCIKHTLGVCGMWGHVILISDLLRPLWCRFGVKEQELDDQLPNVVIAFEANARTI